MSVMLLAMHSFNLLISASSFLERLRETSILTQPSLLIKLYALTLQKSMRNRTPFCSPKKRHIQEASDRFRDFFRDLESTALVA
jgi:hypothetical protein